MPPQENGTAALVRPRYFDRQQLTASDLNLGLDYARERMRRHNRFLHGWGVVCGALIQQVDPVGDPWSFQIGAGYALSPHGDEIYIPAATTIDVETMVLGCLGTQEDCPEVHLVGAMINPAGRDPRANYNAEWVEIGLTDSRSLEGWRIEHTLNIDTPRERMATYYTFREETRFEAGSVIRIHSGSAARHESPPPDRINRYVADPGELGNWRLNNTRDRLRIVDPAGNVVDEQVFLPESALPIGAGTVYLAVCPEEEPCYPAVSMPEGCDPAGGAYDFSRVCEGYRVRVLCRLPASHETALPSCDDLEAILCGEALPACPPAPGADDDCVVLATIGVRGTPIDVDNRRDRRVLLSEALLQQTVSCRCEEEPVPTSAPTVAPTIRPTVRPTFQPTFRPTFQPTFRPTFQPTFRPTFQPTFRPTFSPTFQPTFRPTFQPTFRPTFQPTFRPTFRPTFSPTFIPLGPIDFTDLDLDRGRTLPVRDIQDIGPVRGDRLEAAGIDNVFLFATRPAEELAEILGVSEVRVAELQERARALMRRDG